MSKRSFYITIAMVLVLLALIILFGACAVKKSEAEIAEIDTFIDEIESTTNHNVVTATETSTGVIEETTTPQTTEETTEETTKSIEELANLVLNQGINGEERKAYLGSRYDEVQRYIDDSVVSTDSVSTNSNFGGSDYYYDSDALNPEDGINYYYGTLETYYNLDMSGVVDWMHSLGYEGDYWIRGDGVKMFGDYVMVAADYGWMPKGSIVETSLGLGMVCDTGSGGWYWFDIATNW